MISAIENNQNTKEDTKKASDNNNTTPTNTTTTTTNTTCDKDTTPTNTTTTTTSAVEISSKTRSSSFNAPTPANTPLNSTLAPISSKQFKSTLSSMAEQPSSVSSILSQNPQLLNALQGRLGKLVGKSSGYIESLPESVQASLVTLHSLQADHQKLASDFDREVIELEKKYEKLYSPLYEKRAIIVNGQDGIPEFWLTIFKNSPIIEQLLRECDEPVLKHLKDVKCTLLTDNPGFRLEFEFAENEYFGNKILTKTYHLEESNESADFMFDHAEGCLIDWKEGKNLTVKIELKKQRNKSTKHTRIVKKTVPNETFFNFFSPPILSHDDDGEDGDGDDGNQEEDEEGMGDEVQEAVQFDYEVGEHFKDSIVPRAVDWFTGKAAQEFMEEMEGDYDDYEGEGSEDDDDHDEDNEDEDDEEGHHSSSVRASSSSDQKPDCKQQ